MQKGGAVQLDRATCIAILGLFGAKERDLRHRVFVLVPLGVGVSGAGGDGGEHHVAAFFGLSRQIVAPKQLRGSLGRLLALRLDAFPTGSQGVSF